MPYGTPGWGSVTWLQETEGTFSGLTGGWLCGVGYWGPSPGTGHEMGGARGTLLAVPLPWLSPQAWKREMGADFQGWGGHGRSLACYLRSWGIPSPLPACWLARVPPSLALSPPSVP